MDKILTKKEFKKKFEELTHQDRTSKLKPALSLRDYDIIEDIIKSNTGRSLGQKLFEFINSRYRTNKKQYIVVQLVGLLIILSIGGYIWFGNFMKLSELTMPGLTAVITMVYLLMNMFAYKRRQSLIGSILKLIKRMSK